MKSFATKQCPSTSFVREMNWKPVLVLSLLIMGGTAGRPSVAHARNQAMEMGQAKPGAADQAKDQKGELHEVSIDNFSFTPMEITIPAGTQVTWINKDDVPHTVVSVDHKFKSQALDTDEKFSFTFQNAGTYEYFCSVHPKMTGKIVVK
jgi:plastocyanin